MLKTVFTFLLLFSMTVSLSAFAGGDGSQYNPYRVSNITELQDVNNNLGAYFIQINDIDPANIYSVWRLAQNANNFDDDAVIMNSFEEFALPEEDDSRQIIISVDGQYWTYLNNVPAVGYSVYSYITPSLVDSSASLSQADYESTYRVLYMFPNSYLTSNSASGYSVDNIAPYATDNVQVAISNERNTFLTLSWDEVTEGGYNGNSYPEQNGIWDRVYAGSNPNFDCIPANLLATTQDTSYDVDISRTESKYFKVVVSDQP